MGVISTGNFAKALLPGINAWFGDEYKEHPEVYSKIFDVSSSDRNYEEDVLMSGLGLAKIKPEGSAVSYDDMGQGYTKRYTHVTRANGFIVTREMIEDNQAEVRAEKMTRALKRGMIQTREIVAANVLNRAFSSSYLGGDGVELSSSVHPTLAQDLRNELTTPADLSEAALEQAFIDLGDFRDNRGLRMSAKGMKLVIPKELEFIAHRILKSNLRVSVSDNDANAIKDMGMLPGGIVVNHHLTDTDAWFIKTDVADGLKYLDRRPLSIESDNDFDTFNAKFLASMRFTIGWTDPRGIFCSEGAA